MITTEIVTFDLKHFPSLNYKSARRRIYPHEDSLWLNPTSARIQFFRSLGQKTVSHLLNKWIYYEISFLRKG